MSWIQTRMLETRCPKTAHHQKTKIQDTLLFWVISWRKDNLICWGFEETFNTTSELHLKIGALISEYCMCNWSNFLSFFFQDLCVGLFYFWHNPLENHQLLPMSVPTAELWPALGRTGHSFLPTHPAIGPLQSGLLQIKLLATSHVRTHTSLLLAKYKYPGVEWGSIYLWMKLLNRFLNWLDHQLLILTQKWPKFHLFYILTNSCYDRSF